MLRMNGHRVAVAQGEVVLFADHETGGAMWQGSGPRVIRTFVHFPEPFAEAPAVQVVLTMWDIANIANARADIAAEDIAPEGFAILFRTWGDTRVARVRAGWLAIGPARDEDEWDVV